RFDGPIRVFMEDILLSDRFGQAGIWGSVGWGQYLDDKEIAGRYTDKKLMLYSKLSRLIPFCVFQDNRGQSDIAGKLRYKLWRAMVPHAEMSPSEWLNKVVRSETSHCKGFTKA
ncbi:MAG: hypothetical protein Q8K51_07470, partial [Nitrospirota bacterium]|nr:hypothetical protein [Nitrospirota bacterium]